MTTFMSKEKSTSFIHEDMKRDACTYPEDNSAARRQPKRR
jgi:hypothetical protein